MSNPNHPLAPSPRELAPNATDPSERDGDPAADAVSSDPDTTGPHQRPDAPAPQIGTTGPHQES